MLSRFGNPVTGSYLASVQSQTSSLMKPNSTAHLILVGECVRRGNGGTLIALISPEPELDWFVLKYFNPNPSVPPTLPWFRWHRPGVVLAQSSKITSNGGEEQLQKKTCNGFPRWEVSNKQMGSFTFWQHVLCPRSCSNTWSYLTVAHEASHMGLLLVHFPPQTDFSVEGS